MTANATHTVSLFDLDAYYLKSFRCYSRLIQIHLRHMPCA